MLDVLTYILAKRSGGGGGGGGGTGGDTVVVTPIQRFGNKIATITVNGTAKDIYSPPYGAVSNVPGDNVVIKGSSSGNIQYSCGELLTLSLTPATSGITDVTFTSGSTPTLLTIQGDVVWLNDFDPTSLKTNTRYEINILNGTLGVVGAWDV